MATAWREIARRSDDVANIGSLSAAERADEAQQEAMRNHMKAFETVCEKLPSGVPPELKKELGTWLEHYKSAAKQDGDRVWKNLTILADKKAKHLSHLSKLKECSGGGPPLGPVPSLLGSRLRRDWRTGCLNG